MTTPNIPAIGNHRRLSAAAGRNHLPDPRPITEYTADYTEPGGKSRITVTLAQPCIIRNPEWNFVDCSNGTLIKAQTVTVAGNDTIVFDFEDTIKASVAFVLVPYQDTAVQNFQGGFVRPGGQWFRAAS